MLWLGGGATVLSEKDLISLGARDTVGAKP